MSEKITEQNNERMASPEVTNEHYERSAEHYEKKAEQSKVENVEKQAERARVEALEKAISAEKGDTEKKKAPKSTTKRGINKKERDASFNQRMKQVRKNMSAPERAFSAFIHAKPVEKISEAVGSTIARPNAILTGAVVAFIVVLAVYVIAKNYGYYLSGFETIAAFIVGWIIGLLYDFFRVMITGKK